MTKFSEIYFFALFVVVFWHIYFLFIHYNSKYMKCRFRKALDTVVALPTHDMNIIYKNKQFNVNVQHKEVNNVYSYYEVWINGSLAATYHRIKGMWLSSYVFAEENNRHAWEVRSIVYAANKEIKKAVKHKKVKENGFTEYSYFN
jgi:hypothetical protein